MSIQLRLDAPALAALFPEGSQARLDLQQAVVAEFVGRHLKPRMVAAEVMSVIEKARRDAVQEILSELHVTSAWTPKLSEKFLATLREEARAAVTVKMGEMIIDAVEEKASYVAHNANAAVTRISDKVMRDMLSEKLKGLLAP